MKTAFKTLLSIVIVLPAITLGASFNQGSANLHYLTGQVQAINSPGNITAILVSGPVVGFNYSTTGNGKFQLIYASIPGQNATVKLGYNTTWGDGPYKCACNYTITRNSNGLLTITGSKYQAGSTMCASTS